MATVDVSASTDAYHRLVADLWRQGDTFLLVEHDICPTDRALRQARHCRCWWSVSPYNGPGLDPLYGSLGFTRFRRQLLAAEPDALDAAAAVDDSRGVAAGDWRRLDVRLLGVLRQRGYQPHIHTPVLQHHVYQGVCACGTDHPPFPVDQEGRYQPT